MNQALKLKCFKVWRRCWGTAFLKVSCLWSSGFQSYLHPSLPEEYDVSHPFTCRNFRAPPACQVVSQRLWWCGLASLLRDHASQWENLYSSLLFCQPTLPTATTVCLLALVSIFLAFYLFLIRNTRKWSIPDFILFVNISAYISKIQVFPLLKHGYINIVTPQYL